MAQTLPTGRWQGLRGSDSGGRRTLGRRQPWEHMGNLPQTEGTVSDKVGAGYTWGTEQDPDQAGPRCTGYISYPDL